MKLTVTKDAALWYKNEMGLEDGDFLRFFVKYGGNNQFHPNFSLGVVKQEPENIAISQKQEGIMFYFEKQDEWFIEGIELTVGLQNGEAEFIFERE